VKSKQRGVGLIEVLVALVVFALGVVGLAGLQLRTLSMSMDSTQRAVVIAKSQDIADRIRSSGAGALDYLGTYNSASCDAVPNQFCSDGSADGAVINTASCDSVQMAAFDVWDVFCGNNSGLEGSVVQWSSVISCNSAVCDAADSVLTISTTWVSRVADTDQDIASGDIVIDGVTVNATTDSMSLSFVR